MEKARRASSGFDRLPDHLVTRILVAASSGVVEGLCRYRTVCSRFNRIAAQAEKVTCQLQDAGTLKSGVVRYLQDCQGLKSLCFTSPISNAGSIPDLFWPAISGATPGLTHCEISHANLCPSDTASEEPTHELLRTMAKCPQLRLLKLDSCRARLDKPVSAQHTFKSLTNIHLSDCYLEDPCLQSLMKACPCLKDLALDGINGLVFPTISSGSMESMLIKPCDDIDNVRIKMPQLAHLKAVFIGKLFIDAPNLVELMLDACWEVEREVPWKVATLEIREGPRSQEELNQIFRLCPDSRTVRLDDAMNVDNDAYEDGVDLVELLQPFERLESLTLPSDMHPFIAHPKEQEGPLLLSRLFYLKKLSIGLSDIDAEFDLAMELVKLAPNLERVVIDVRDMLDGEVSDLVRSFLEIQKQYPHLEVHVQWPKGLSVGDKNPSMKASSGHQFDIQEYLKSQLRVDRDL